MNKKYTFSNIMILSIIFVFMLILSTGLSSAAVLNVTGSNENGNYSTIKDAINNLSKEHTILVYDGTYIENLLVSVPGLVIKAAEGSNVVLKPPPPDPTFPVITILADNVTICGFNIEGPDFGTGIKSQGKNGLVLKNNTINTSFIGITLEAGSNCTLENNTVYGADFGISLKNFCKNNSLKQNSIKDCAEGVFLRNSCTENILSGNNFSDNFRALYLDNLCSENSLASNFFVNNSISLSLEAECNWNILDNNTVRKGQYGFYFGHSCNNNTLRENNVSDSQYAYYLKASCEKNTLNNNTAFGNLYGFYLSHSPYNTLYGNRLSNNTRGIYVEACDNTTLLSNVASHNIMEGVFLEDSSDNRLSGNNVSNNSEGIKLDGLCSRNTLKENLAFGNSKGLLFRFTTSNLFRANNVSFNEYGLIFISSNNNILNDSFVKFNSECGLSLENSEHNTIYNNLFNNTKNAEDDNQDKDSGNIWNVSVIESKPNIYEGPNTGGNYWSDYRGNDSNGDGFGDKPYKSGNITDYLPLFDDVIPPVISVTSPTNKTYTITSIPIYASSNEKISTWNYTIDGAKGSFTGTTPRTAEGSLNLSNGKYILNVSAIDPSGNFNSTEVTFIVKKEDDADRDRPLIKIINPTENSTYTTGDISLYASANESIQEWWYELDGSERREFASPEPLVANTSFELANGSHFIKVYGLDFAGNMNSSSVNFTINIEKPGDGVFPKISILSPLNKSYSIRNIPIFASADENISSWWYTLNGSNSSNGPEAFEFSRSSEGTAYDLLCLENGSYTLEVHGVDTAGNSNSTSVCFGVELREPEDRPPLITIHSPENRTYNKTKISLNASANENIQDWWYVLDNSSALSFNNTTNSNASCIMSAFDGERRVEVWGRDTAGNLNLSTVNFKIDTIPPILDIHSPEKDWSYSSDKLMIFGTSNEDIKKWEYNLNNGSLSGVTTVESRRYEVGNKAFITFSEVTTRWVEILLRNLSDKDYVIEIKAWDLAGNYNSTIVNFNVNTTASGDGTLPLITIKSPEEKVYPNVSVPLNASANETILKWLYVLDSSVYFTFNNIDNFSVQSVLNTTEGDHRLKVYGIDLAKNMNSSACNFTVDTEAPRITIISPENGSEFEIKDGGSEYTVDLNVSLSESCYFSYRVGSAPFSKTVYGNEFNETLKLGAGSYDITLRAEDEAGNLGRNYTSIRVWKNDLKPDSGISSYDGGGRRRFDRVLSALLARMGSDEGDRGDDAGDGGALALTPMLKNEEFSPAVNNSKVEDKDSIFSTTNAGILLLTTALLILFIKYMMYFRRDK